MWVQFGFFAALVACVVVGTGANDDESRAQAFIDGLNGELANLRNIQSIATWNFESNITDYNEEVVSNISIDGAKYSKTLAGKLKVYDFETFKNASLKRVMKTFADLGDDILPEPELKELIDAVAAMEKNYAKVKLCDFRNRTKCDLALEPELTEIFDRSQDVEELKYYWVEWYNHAGAPTKEHFKNYLQFSQKSAEMNGYKSKAEAWLDNYEDPTFEDQIERAMRQIMPLYEQLHAYARFKLRERYGKENVPEDGPVPMHLTGNLWAQQWDTVAAFSLPYPEKPPINVTAEMIKQKYTPLKMFQMGDDFFRSLNMTALSKTFWERSIIEKPNDGRELVCHASAWDFFDQDDFRIKQCTRVNMDDFHTVHHELGHIQYFMQYKHQPVIYRDGANPGFHEAVGDTIGLSITPEHLKKVGLLGKDFVLDEKTRINEMYKTGLSKIMFLPVAYVFDKYRWELFRGNVKESEYNCKFWKLREEMNGVTPPVARTENDFDAPAKYHITSNTEYLRYFVSYIIQFQFHKALCLKANEYDPNDPKKPLDGCDIYQSTAAGNALKEMLSMGSSKPWPDAMKVLTGEPKMDITALLEYFKPLEKWLVEFNTKNGVHVGWIPSGNYHC